VKLWKNSKKKAIQVHRFSVYLYHNIGIIGLTPYRIINEK
jgi:hypothetical protein